MIPLSKSVRAAYGIPFLPLTDEGAVDLPPSIAETAARFSTLGRVAYVEAEFFGGTGTQACVTWDGTDRVSDVLVDTSAINTALRFLGVRKEISHDEFDAVGLGHYRDTDEWEKAEPDSAASGG